jgi:pentatricopeptide repeat protein
MAAAGRYQDMEELFQSMQAEEEDGIEAGISSYDSVLFARIEEKSWDGVFSLYDQMKANGIKPSARTVKGLIIANDQTGGSESVSLALQSLLSCKAQFDESAFRLASETLFEEVDEDLDEFRKNIREIGEQNKHLRVASLDLVRSIRSAETVSSRPEHMRESKYETQHSGEDAWRLATSHLLVFVQAWLENSDGVEQNYEE